MRRTSLLLSLVVAVTACSASPPPAPPSSVGTRVSLTVPGSIRTAPLIDSHGHRTSLAAWSGKIVVLTDFLTLCQEICPLTSANFRQLVESVRAAGLTHDVEFVELTVDPERDTPQRLRAYQQLIGQGRNWALLTGSSATISQLWRHFGVDVQKTSADSAARDWWTHRPLTYDVDHTDAVIFLDQKGKERFLIDGAPNTGGHAPPAALRHMLDAKGRRNLARPSAMAWTVPQALGVIGWLAGRKVPVA